MNRPAANFNRVLEHLNISNATLAKWISIDTSSISRWRNGTRQLKFSSEVMSRLADYLLDKAICSDNMEWLARQMAFEGLQFHEHSMDELENAFKLWLSTDVESYGGALRLVPKADGTAAAGTVAAGGAESQVRIGYPQIAALILDILNSLPEGAQIGVHLSNADTGVLLHESVRRALLDAINQKALRVKLLISISTDTEAMSRLISQYTPAMLEGNLSVSVVHGMIQAITHQTTFIFGDEAVLIVCEAPKSIAPPAGAVVRDEMFMKECGKSFERTYNYSHALFQRYTDNYSRNVLEIFYEEFCLPGELDIIKDNINPMYMTAKSYDCALRAFGNRGEQFKWRSAEYARFKTGLDGNLNNGSVFREALSRKRLEQIVTDGKCKMPALYFFFTGMVYLDAAGCLAIIEGYIDYLSRFPNFNLLILDEITVLNESSCWHLKRNSHMMLNGWSNDEHINLYSNQLMVTFEFHRYFNDLWDREHYSEGRRRKTVEDLRYYAKCLKANHNLP